MDHDTSYKKYQRSLSSLLTKQERESSSKAGTIISPEDQLDFQLFLEVPWSCI